jgi:hypothetical protein
MYVLEEYLAAIVLAIGLGIWGIAILTLVVGLQEEERFLDRVLLTGSVALPRSWPKLWAVMKIAERWQRFSVSSSQKARRVFRRLDIVSRAGNLCKAASGRMGNEVRAVKDRTARLIPWRFLLRCDAGHRNPRGGTKNGSLLF